MTDGAAGPWNDVFGGQFGAAIDALEAAMRACPDELWSDPEQQPGFWYLAYHTLFWTDLYLSGSVEGFAPPAPFTLDEMDREGVMPERTYGKDELLDYLAHCRARCRAVLAALTEEDARRRSDFAWLEMSVAEAHLYNMRHVQHGAGQLNLILRRETDSAPGWVFRASDDA